MTQRIFDLNRLVRKNILKLKPYSSARDEFKGEAKVLLDANENPYGEIYNRYPDPLQKKLKDKIATLKAVSANQLFLGNGSDEVIDLLMRAFCTPLKDNIISFSPSYTMYNTSAEINDIEVRELLLNPDFSLPLDELWKTIDENSKLIFICTPNNPTGNLVSLDVIKEVCLNFSGLVIVDEAYIDFTDSPSALTLLAEYPNLCVIQTLSKAFGLAGVRLGMGYGSIELIEILNRIKPPYNVSQSTQDIVLEKLSNRTDLAQCIANLKIDRELLYAYLNENPLFERVFKSEGNFILVQTKHYTDLYDYLCAQGIVVRKRHIPPLLENGLRITVGTPSENEQLLMCINQFKY